MLNVLHSSLQGVTDKAKDAANQAKGAVKVRRNLAMPSVALLAAAVTASLGSCPRICAAHHRALTDFSASLTPTKLTCCVPNAAGRSRRREGQGRGCEGRRPGRSRPVRRRQGVPAACPLCWPSFLTCEPTDQHEFVASCCWTFVMLHDDA